MLFKTGMILAFSTLWMGQIHAQTTPINQRDTEGKRHGVWKKFYDHTEQLQYEGTFKHGKETGTFKFYSPKGGKPIATKTYRAKDDTLVLKFYNQSGDFLKSEGTMVGKSREGIWKYYKKGYKENLLMTEAYHNNQLHGAKTIYFPDGKITEIEHYSHGQKEGKKQVYSFNGQLLQSYTYKNGKLHGPSTVYDASGEKISEGAYKNGLRYGEWKFYTKGKLDSTQTYPIRPLE